MSEEYQTVAETVAAEERRERFYAGLALRYADADATDEQVLKLAMISMMGRGNPAMVLAAIRQLRTDGSGKTPVTP